MNIESHNPEQESDSEQNETNQGSESKEGVSQQVIEDLGDIRSLFDSMVDVNPIDDFDEEVFGDKKRFIKEKVRDMMPDEFDSEFMQQPEDGEQKLSTDLWKDVVGTIKYMHGMDTEVTALNEKQRGEFQDIVDDIETKLRKLTVSADSLSPEALLQAVQTEGVSDKTKDWLMDKIDQKVNVEDINQKDLGKVIWSAPNHIGEKAWEMLKNQPSVNHDVLYEISKTKPDHLPDVVAEELPEMFTDQVDALIEAAENGAEQAQKILEEHNTGDESYTELRERLVNGVGFDGSD